MDKSDNGLSHPFKDPEAVATAMKGLKNPVMYLFGAKYRTVELLRFVTDKDRKIQFGRTWGLFLETCLRTYSDIKCLFVLLWRNGS